MRRNRPGYLQCTGDDWDKARMRALVRDDFQCQAHHLGLCKEPCGEHKVRHLVVHHLKMRVHGGTHDLGNLITLCNKHHVELHPHMRFELAQKAKVFEMVDREL